MCSGPSRNSGEAGEIQNLQLENDNPKMKTILGATQFLLVDLSNAENCSELLLNGK